jgi:hypothetical protein
MAEWVLVVWLISASGHITDPIEIGTYRLEGKCQAARDSIEPANGTSFVARCIERDK